MRHNWPKQASLAQKLETSGVNSFVRAFIAFKGHFFENPSSLQLM